LLNPTPSSPPWIAVYVKHRHEKNVVLNLDSKGISSFLPLYSQRNKSGKIFDLPLFPGYVFCQLELQNSLAVRTTPGVFTIVGDGSGPAIIPSWEIDRLRHTVGSKVAIKPWPYVSIGDEVHLESGPLRGVRGVVVNDDHDQWLVLSVHLLKRSVAVRVERSQLAANSRSGYEGR